MTAGFPGSQNDKTISRTDKLIQALKKQPLFTDYKFNLFNVQGALIERTGAYAIVDGGYHRWRVLQCAFKHANHRTMAWAWSRWFGSTRKDVDCLFGSLKKRFRILRNPLSFQYALDIHNVMWTCCVLHNMLLRHDGKDKFSVTIRMPRDEDECIDADGFGSEPGEDSEVAHSGSDSDRETEFDQELRSTRENPNTFVQNETFVEEEAGWSDLRGDLIAHFVYLRESEQQTRQF